MGIDITNPYIAGTIVVWELIWKGQALWKSARKSQKVWFFFILIVNSIGILPIIYLLIDVLQKKTGAEAK